MPGWSARGGESSRAAREAIGAWVRDHREFLRLSQEDLRRRLARRGIHVTQSTISRWENGELAPSADALAEVASIVGTTIASLEEYLAAAHARSAVPVDLTGRSVEDLVEEADLAAHAGNYPRALALLEAGVDLLRLRGEESVPVASRAALYLRLARAHAGRWNLAAARAALRRLAALPGVTDAIRFQGRLVRVAIAQRDGDREEYEALAAVVVRELPSIGDDVLRAHATHVIGFTRYAREEYDEAARWLREARSAWEAAGNELERLRVAVTLGFCLATTGDGKAGEAITREALEEARRRGFRDIEARGLLLLGRIRSWAGQMEQAFGLFEDAATLARQLGLPELEFIALYRGWSEASAGLPPDDRERFDRRMRRLLPRVPARMPEVRAFRDEAGEDILEEGDEEDEP